MWNVVCSYISQGFQNLRCRLHLFNFLFCFGKCILNKLKRIALFRVLVLFALLANCLFYGLVPILQWLYHTRTFNRLIVKLFIFIRGHPWIYLSANLYVCLFPLNFMFRQFLTLHRLRLIRNDFSFICVSIFLLQWFCACLLFNYNFLSHLLKLWLLKPGVISFLNLSGWIFI